MITLNDIKQNEDIQDILEESYIDFSTFCKVFFPEEFFKDFSSLHLKIIEKIEKDVKKVVIQAPRGIGKTSLVKAYIARAILFADKHFIVYISNSSTNATLQTEGIKSMLRVNPLIKELFGDIKTNKVEGDDKTFGKIAWVATVDTHQTLVLPRGSGQQVRGLLWGRFRPDLVIIDDLEDTDTIDNEEQREKRKRWFFGDVMKTKSLASKDFKLIYIDTLKHEDALLQHILDDESWESLSLSLCDDNYKSLAPDFMSDKEIMDEVIEHRNQGLLDVFAMEYMGRPISGESASFRPEFFKYYKESDEEFLLIKNRLINIVIVDPAKTVSRSSAETGVVVWGVDPVSGKLYLRYAVGEHLHPDEQVMRAFDVADTFNASVLGVEDTGLGEFVTYPFINESVKRGNVIEVIPLRAKRGRGEFSGDHGGKKARIFSLVPYYRQGLVYHNQDMTGAYEIQLLGFPKSKKWDIMDAAAYVTEILDMGNVIITPADGAEEVWEEIDYDKPIEDWRTAP